MSRRIPIVLLALISASALTLALSVSAQEDDYDDEYDDEEYDNEEYDDGEGEYEEGNDEEAEYEEGEYEEGEFEEEGGEDAAESEEEAPLRHSSNHGETGLFHVVSADSGEMLTFAVGLHVNFSIMSEWLVNRDVNNDGVIDTDSNSFVGGTAHLRFTVWDYIEAYMAIDNYANANEWEEPQLFQTLGDIIIGFKGFYPVLPWLSIGGGVGLHLLNTVGDVGVFGSGTSVALRVASTFDIQRVNPRVPLRIHLNFDYYFDNSSALVEDVERDRAGITSGNGCSYDINGDGDPDDDAGCITRIERTALQISRLDTASIRLGIEVPTRYIVPIVEYNVGIPVNRQGFNCVYREDEEGIGTAESMYDSCYDIERGAAMPMWLTLGARVLPWVRGLAVNLAVDIGLTGTRTFVQELPAIPPYMVYLGLSYSYNPRRRVIETVREVEVEVESAEQPAPPVIVGRALDSENQQGIVGALVSFPGRDLTTLSTGENGAFRSWPLSAGEVTVHVEHPEYNAADCTATLPETGETTLECGLTPTPRRGTLAGRVTDEEGGAVTGASVMITPSGGAAITVTTDSNGAFEREVLAGSYSVQVEAEGFMRRGGRSVEVQARERTMVDLQLRRQPRQALVRIQGNRIRILRPVHFRHNSAEIDPDSHALLEQVADVMLRNPDLCRIEIQGHTDSSGSRQRNQTLSQERAAAVLTFLVETGVGQDRLTATGHGPDRPVAPNITSEGRSRNRRVEFHITERCEAQ